MNEFQQLGVGQQAGQQLAPQGFLGSVFGAPLGGLIGRGIGGLLGNSQLGGQIGQLAGGVGGGFLPLSADPYQQYQQQLMQQQLVQQQLAQQQGQQGQMSPQGWFGSAISQFGKPLGGLIGGIAGNQQLGSTIGGIASQLGGMLPFSADPYQQFASQQGQQGQMSPQGFLPSNLAQFLKPPLSSMISDYIPPRQGLGLPYGGFLPFPIGAYQQQGQQQGQQGQQAQPVQQGQQAQPGQVAPQGWFGSAISQFGKPLGGLIGGIAGNQQLGSTIGGIASQLGGMLPFAVGPQDQQAHEQAMLQQLQQQIQQAQQAQQVQQLQQQLLQQQQQGQQAQGGQVAPQGWVGNALTQLGQPLGGLIGGLAGNQQLGNTIGGIASQLGGMLPFSVEPSQLQQVAQQLAQQQQQGQQGQMSPQGWFGSAISQFGKPLGGLIGGIAGNQQLGSTIGGIASQLGGMLPFSADPYQQYAQHAYPGQYPIYQAYGGQQQQGNSTPYTVH